MNDQPRQRPMLLSCSLLNSSPFCAKDYGLKDLQADAVAGLTVAIVALPLSMAIEIALSISKNSPKFKKRGLEIFDEAEGFVDNVQLSHKICPFD
jgi:hypothetical protein